MAGTTSSSGLNNLLESTNKIQTTLPTWMDTAQQNVINQAGTASNAAPAFANTTAQGSVNTLQGANNPFNQAQGSLNSIASGAANPWITDPNTGAVSPNTNTAMGGLFAAQTNQLNQLMPTMTAPTEAGAIGSGNFGSLRGQTAVDTARTNALANLQAEQMQAALTNQNTGATAAAGLGNVGTQGITAGLTTGAAQMNAPYQNATNYANLVNSVNAPGTVSTQNQESPLQMLSVLGGAPSATGSLLNSLGIGTGSNSVLNSLGSGISGGLNSLFGNTPSSIPAGLTYNASTKQYTDGGGNFYTQNSSGQLVDSSGNPAPSQYQTTANIPTSTTGDTASGSGSTQPDPNYNPANNPPPLSWTDTASGSGSTQPDPNYTP